MFIINNSKKLEKILIKYLDDLKTKDNIIIDDANEMYSCFEFLGGFSFFYEIRFYNNENKVDLLIRKANGGYINEYTIVGTNDNTTIQSYFSIINELDRQLNNNQKIRIAKFIYLFNTTFTKIKQIINKINNLQSDIAQILG